MDSSILCSVAIIILGLFFVTSKIVIQLKVTTDEIPIQKER